ncbi:MAG: replicative DNA helicase [Bacillota bacterium]|nr:replicative DNA helicase [Bacillota bacterium]
MQELPFDEAAERALIGLILLDPDRLGDVHEILHTPEMFYVRHNRLIYESILAMYGGGQSIDAVTVANYLEKNQQLEQVGGFEYLKNSVDEGIMISDAAAVARILYDHYLLRTLILTSNEIAAKGYAKSDAAELLEEAEQRIFEIAMKKNRRGLVSINEILPEIYERIRTMYSNPQAIQGISTGFPDLDAMTTGFKPSELILIAARPSMGKTALAINIVQHMAVHENKKVAIFSLEMDAKSLVDRMLSGQTYIESNKIKSGDLTADQMETLGRAQSYLARDNIFIDETSGISVTEMRSKLRKLKMQKGLDVVMIDYIQLMSGDGKAGENRQQEISYISRSLKAIAREMQCPVIALSQLSRANEQRGDKKPILSDLRESGAIEQDADLVLFIHREEYYKREQTDEKLKGVGEIIIAKQRNGETGSIYLAWLGQYTLFRPLTRQTIDS